MMLRFSTRSWRSTASSNANDWTHFARSEDYQGTRRLTFQGLWRIPALSGWGCRKHVASWRRGVSGKGVRLYIQRVSRTTCSSSFLDVEMSEGQNYEAMLYAAKTDMGELCVAVDCNGWGQDGRAMGAGRIAKTFNAAGWMVSFAVQTDADSLAKCFASFGTMPVCWIVETRKGQGVSFMMEHPEIWHQRAPNAEEYARAKEELDG